ncbi:ribonuclease HII [candidate division WOR-1 bacterium RIFCSPHIGHO2_01_FULL_53_15]|uniref:Ribonuclease HII n=1 Tax=candidate division WOR-1 bacterium RIFCSPHIGHO2_01_FULL_53_15 TaxID=1802564 RepID=A0A1F4Q065_UNCSA|nr:MAG: ribonuclease HII [candidate division WOR-1 bacterium RIFCSPHIGHO2_01_FULL_53_15]
MLGNAYERKLARQGFKLIAGVDEVGRGPLAGPIVAAAVILPLKFSLPGLNDSKKLTAKARERLYGEIKRIALAIGLAMVNHRMIDRINIGRANLLVLKQAVKKLKIAPEYLMVDGGRNRIDDSIAQIGISGGDRKCASIAAASIIAKVTRDRLMIKYHAKYPLYGFNKHMGYGTKEHLKKLKAHGPCPIHRRSFAPLN